MNRRKIILSLPLLGLFPFAQGSESPSPQVASIESLEFAKGLTLGKYQSFARNIFVFSEKFDSIYLEFTQQKHLKRDFTYPFGEMFKNGQEELLLKDLTPEAGFAQQFKKTSIFINHNTQVHFDRHINNLMLNYGFRKLTLF